MDGRDEICSLAFLVDGRHIVSAGYEKKIRLWQVEDGQEAGRPMEVGNYVRQVAVSRDGKWLVSGSDDGRIAVWSALSHEKVAEWRHVNGGSLRAVDVSSDGTRIVTGSGSRTVVVWSLATGERILGPLEHDFWVVEAKFSPDGRFIVTATWERDSLRIYDSHDGRLLHDLPITVSSSTNQSVAWTHDSKRLFALSLYGRVLCLDAVTGATLAEWTVREDGILREGCIVLGNNGMFIAVGSGSFRSIWFWDTATHQQIDAVIDHHNGGVKSIAISENYDIVSTAGNTIILQSLYDILPSQYLADDVAYTRVENCVDHDHSSSPIAMPPSPSDETVAYLENTIQQLRSDLDALTRQSNERIFTLENTIHQLRAELVDSGDNIDNLTKILHAHDRKHGSEALFAQGCFYDAARCLLQVTSNAEVVKTNKVISAWLPGFTCKCITALEELGDEASKIKVYYEALGAYSTALSLASSTPHALLLKWANVILRDGLTDDVLGAASEFKLPRLNVYQAICDVLEENDRVAEATQCFQQMQCESIQETRACEGRVQWEADFRERCSEKLERFSNAATDARNYDEACEYLSMLLLLDSANRTEILIKRSEARSSMNSWENVLSDADEIVLLDPSSYRGYELRHAALHALGRFAEAVEAFHLVLSVLEESSDKSIRERRLRYVDVTPTIRKMTEEMIRHMPSAIIDTATGHLCDKIEQIAAFEQGPIYAELRSSMTTPTNVDHSRIRREAKKYYRYVMFSHKWEDGEPLFQTVRDTSIYELEPSSPNIKLQTLCRLARSFGFHWVWSDTCCINKKDNVVLQESLVAMFTWYHGSSLTIVYLRGVWSQNQKPGDLRNSIWNTRAWTYQEYMATEIVQFYTEDWKPYLGLDVFNHKESAIIIDEMEQVSQVSARQLVALRPGLDRVREKLFLASGRQTSLVEDIAYSLFGIFNVAIPVIYGEGNRAVGRLLEHILTGSGDVTILAWTGPTGSYNSCLPLDLRVYHHLVPPHIPQPIETTEMDNLVTALRLSSSDHSQAVEFYRQLNSLPPPSLVSTRLRFSGIVFSITELVKTDLESGEYMYRATTSALGEVKIKTNDNLSGMEGLILINPWISALLDQDFSHTRAGVGGRDETTRALRFIAHLRQPFDALLLARVSRVQYRRIATDSLIMVQIREETGLEELLESAQTVDVQ